VPIREIVRTIRGKQRTLRDDNARLNHIVAVLVAKAIPIHVQVPGDVSRLVVHLSVAIIVYLVTKFRLQGPLRDGLVVAIVPAIVPVAALLIDGAVPILIAITKGGWITIFVHVVFVAHFIITGESLGVVVVTVITERVTLGVFAFPISTAIFIAVRRLKHAAIQFIATGVDGALDSIIAKRRLSRGQASVLISVLMLGLTAFLPIAKCPIVAFQSTAADAIRPLKTRAFTELAVFAGDFTR